MSGVINVKIGIPSHEYRINIGSGILSNAGSIIVESGWVKCNQRKAAIVTDSNVGPIYADVLAEAFDKIGINHSLITIPAGERSKSQASLEALYDSLMDIGLTRSDIIIALGGGVVGDLTGFAAATLLRGVHFAQVPTSLLAQVDSSIGGKVAINHSKGKNLIGTFYQPITVIADIDCLKTLDKRFYADGMAEVVKYGAAFDAELFELLENGSGNISDTIARCCRIKRDVVERDVRDNGDRMKLNFGHTFAHAIERYYDYKTYTHGEAVSIGMVMACRLGERLGITPPDMVSRLSLLLSGLGLPLSCDADTAVLARLMLDDKKRDGDYINFIISDGIGSSAVHHVSSNELKELVS